MAVVEAVLAGNPDLETARARVREARAQRDAEFAGLFPRLDLGGDAVNSRVWRDRGGDGSVNSYSAGLDASWELDLFGRRQGLVEAAAADLGAQQELLSNARASLAAEAAAAYVVLRANEARLAVLRETVRTREQTAELAGWRYKAGETDALESSRAASSLESARAGVPALQEAIAQGRHRLSALAGRAPGSLDPILERGAGRIPVPPDSLAVGIPADAMRRRPDVREAGLRVLAAAARTRSVSAERYPSLRLDGTLGLRSGDADRFLDPERAAASLLAGITSPVWDAGRIRAREEASKAAEDQAVAGYRSVVVNSLAETENALIACRRSGERLAGLDKAVRLARDADELARRRYEAGEIDFLEVLDSQRSLLALEDQLLATRTDRSNAFIRLYQSLGGGWASDT